MSLLEQQPLQVVTFRLSNEIYALDILCVQEIIKALPLTRVPLTKPWIEGVINLRGQILPLIDLAKRLDLEASPPTRNTRYVIVRTREQSIGLVVDQVSEVLRLGPEDLEPPPATSQDKEYISSVSKHERGLLIILDLNKVLFEQATRFETQEVV